MARTSAADDLLERLHAAGLRKKVAKTLSDAVALAPGRAKPPTGVDKIVSDLRSLASEIEDRVRPGGTKATAKRRSTTRKAATRKTTPARKAATTTRKAATSTRKAASTARKAASPTRASTSGRKQTAAQRSAAAKKGARTRAANAAKK